MKLKWRRFICQKDETWQLAGEEESNEKIKRIYDDDY